MPSVPPSSEQDSRKPVRAVIYTRVSQDRAGGKSVKQQEEACRAVVEANGWNLIAVYCDNDIGASSYTSRRRPDWERLMAKLEAGHYDMLVVWEPSRATRDRGVWAHLSGVCEEKNVKICASGKEHDLADPDSSFMLDIYFAIARRESAMTKRRTNRSFKARTAEGAPAPGKAAFGYRHLMSQTTGKLEQQIPDTAERVSISPDGTTIARWTPSGLIREIFEQTLKGTGAPAIAKSFNSRGIPNPRTIHANEHHPKRERAYRSDWNPNVIRDILRNPVYLGHRRSGGAVVAEDRWPALVTPEEFSMIQGKFAARKRSTSRPGRTQHLLVGVASCGKCGRTVQSTDHLGTAAYRCMWGHTFLRRDEADRQIIWWVTSWLSLPQNIDELRAASGSGEEIEAARTEMTNHQREIDEAETLLAKGDIKAETFAQIKARIQPKLDDAKDRAFVLGVPNALRPFVDDRAPAEAWMELPVTAQREAVEYLTKITLNRVGRGRKNVPISDRMTITRRSAS